MNDQHTPGPWLVGEDGHVDSHFGQIATVAGHENPDDETMPNARLIAAAPELLDVMRDWLSAYELDAGRGVCECMHPEDPCHVCRARALIARVEGEGA